MSALANSRIVVRGQDGQNWHVLTWNEPPRRSWTALCGTGEGNLPYYLRTAILDPGESPTGAYFTVFPNQRVFIDLCPLCRERLIA